MTEQDDRLNAAYRERNLAVQMAAKLAYQIGQEGWSGYHAWWGEDPDEPEWPVLYIDLPTGQVSYHIPREEACVDVPGTSDVHRADRIQYGMSEWDGHTKEQAEERIHEYIGDKWHVREADVDTFLMPPIIWLENGRHAMAYVAVLRDGKKYVALFVRGQTVAIGIAQDGSTARIKIGKP